MAKIGIMGGTFNPIHHVHLIMAEEARRQFGLKKVWFMPSGTPPHKKKNGIVSDEHRKRMIQHAIRTNDAFECSELELLREGTTYTRDTLEYLCQKYPTDSFYFIVGGDSLAQMESWREPDFIFKHCHVLAANRNETGQKELQEWIQYYHKTYGAKVSEIQMPAITISSEMIRKKLHEGKSISHYCPSCVERYIRLNGLYESPEENVFDKTPSDEELLTCLAAVLKPKRLMHSLGVAVTAANMATVHGCDSRKAYIAGMLHDCAKYLTGEEQISICDKKNIFLTEVEKTNPVLIHGKLGAYFAQTKYQVTDEEILSAITWHTTGRPNMTMLEQIIYLADYMEPERNMNPRPYSLREIRRASFVDLTHAVAMVSECSARYLETCGKPIDHMTIETYQYYKEKDGGTYA